MKETAAVILAAGLGTRMGSDLPKVIHPLGGKKMIDYVLEVTEDAGVEKIIAVVGYKGEMVAEALGGRADVVRQKKMMGTGDAVAAAKDALAGFDGNVLVLYGDVPLLKAETIRRLINEHEEGGSSCTMLTVYLPDPAGFGRILRDDNGDVKGIIEEADAASEQKNLKEINAGVYCFNSKHLFEGLSRIKPNNRKGEYYLTDIIAIFSRSGKRVRALVVDDREEVVGINTPQELRRAEEILAKRERELEGSKI
ncbi:MAG: NTP transferase domain-containing protein [Candidatus Omnitrophica bacterium]|nr:NTP transferase domain-containing protein [Candidatus Omnitrophota bacterium]